MPQDRIISLDDLLDYFPPFKRVAHEYHTACPFCTVGTPVQTYKGRIFRGDDRFVIRRNGRGGFCRRCSLEGGGDRGNGWWSMNSIGKQLGLSVGQEFRSQLRDLPIDDEPLRMLWKQSQVDQAHATVDRAYWYQFEWNDATIDHFQLGKGTLYKRNPNVHIIPMQVTRLDDTEPSPDFVVSTRGVDATTGKSLKERTPGSISPYSWVLHEDKTSTAIYVVEGEKDMVSAYQMGYRNLICCFGVNHFTSAKVNWLKKLGFDRIVDLIDDDTAGRALANRVGVWCYQHGIQWVRNTWEGKPDGVKDLTELLQMLKTEGAKAFLAEALVLQSPEVSGRVTIRSELVIDIEAGQEEDTLLSVDELRGNGPNSIRTQAELFLQGYDAERKRGEGKVLLLSIPPGAGKTYAIIQLVEALIEKELPKKHAELGALKKAQANVEQQLEDKGLAEEDRDVLINAHRKVCHKVENFSFEIVSWFGQYKEGFADLMSAGANPKLWFNYEARNAKNCDNLEFVQDLGAKNHDIGSFCRFSCPFRERCRESAFLRQELDRRSYPVTFLRHQHLLSPQLVKDRKLIIVDEYAGSVFEASPVIFNIEDVSPSREGWELDVEDAEKAAYVTLFTDAVRSAMSYNIAMPKKVRGHSNDEAVTGGAFVLSLIDQHLRSNGSSLDEVTTIVDSQFLHRYYQPTYTQGGNNNGAFLQIRCVPFLFDTILRELPDYLENPKHKFPSCINLIAGSMEIYPVASIPIASKVPIIALDGTSFPSLYRAMFSREVAPKKIAFRNPNASTTVYVGSDFTHGAVQSSLGHLVRNKKLGIPMTATSIEGQVFDAERVAFDTSIGDTKIVKDCKALIDHLVARHSNLLVVTHKTLREILEYFMYNTYPTLKEVDAQGRRHVVFGHYGALRGTNAYIDYDAVLLIGAFRIPYDILWRRIQMWASLLGMRVEIPIATVIKNRAYHTKTIGHGFRTFDNEFAEEYVEMVESGEMQQCAERIRPHSSKSQKFVYVMANRPSLRYVDNIYDKNGTVKQLSSNDNADVRQYIDEYRLSNNDRQPSMRALAKHFKRSLRDIQQIVRSYRNDLEMSKTPTGEDTEDMVD